MPVTDGCEDATDSTPAGERNLKVLYLDYDGVLHHEDVRWKLRVGAFMNAPGFHLFEHATLLDELLRPYPDLAIVLSTSWVVQFGCSRSAKRLPPGLSTRVVGATFHSEMSRRRFEALTRGRQVMEDVERRKPVDWFALDDTDEGWPEDFRDRVVITHEQLGIFPSEVITRVQANLHRMYGQNSQS